MKRNGVPMEAHATRLMLSAVRTIGFFTYGMPHTEANYGRLSEVQSMATALAHEMGKLRRARCPRKQSRAPGCSSYQLPVRTAMALLASLASPVPPTVVIVGCGYP